MCLLGNESSNGIQPTFSFLRHKSHTLSSPVVIHAFSMRRPASWSPLAVWKFCNTYACPCLSVGSLNRCCFLRPNTAAPFLRASGRRGPLASALASARILSTSATSVRTACIHSLRCPGRDAFPDSATPTFRPVPNRLYVTLSYTLHAPSQGKRMRFPTTKRPLAHKWAKGRRNNRRAAGSRARLHRISLPRPVYSSSYAITRAEGAKSVEIP
jgi:hypothetical protein